MAKAIDAAGRAAEAATCDVTDHGQVDAPPAAAADRFGQVGILVNSAGTMAGELRVGGNATQ